MKEPTARQREIYEAVQREGSFAKAGEVLGVTIGAISSGVTGYRRHTGAEAPTTYPQRQRRQLRPAEILAAITERLVELEAATAEIVEGQANLTDELIRLRGLLEQMLARQPLVLEVRARHERKADGGLGGRREVTVARRHLEPA